MASIQQKDKGWYYQFVYRGKRRPFAVGRVTRAETKAAQVDYLLMRLEQRLIELPPGTDVVAFLRCDGAPPAEELPATKVESTLGVSATPTSRRTRARSNPAPSGESGSTSGSSPATSARPSTSGRSRSKTSRAT